MLDVTVDKVSELLGVAKRGERTVDEANNLAEANLWTQFSEKNSPEFVNTFMRRVRLKNFLRHFAIYHYVVEIKLRNFYERHRTKFIPVDPQNDPSLKSQQEANPQATFRAAIEDLCRVAQEGDVKPVLIYLPALDEALSTNSPPVLLSKREVSQKLNVPLVDLTADMKAGRKWLYLEGDPVHFNDGGNEVIAQRLLEAIRPLVKAKP